MAFQMTGRKRTGQLSDLHEEQLRVVDYWIAIVRLCGQLDGMATQCAAVQLHR